MKTVMVSESTAARLSLLARAWNVDEGGAVARLLDEFTIGGAEGRAASEGDSSQLGVHAVYNGQRIEGRFHLETGRLEVVKGPCAGDSFKSPSGAAIAVVQTLNPRVNPNRNGWTFWTVTSTGETLQSRRRDAM